MIKLEEIAPEDLANLKKNVELKREILVRNGATELPPVEEYVARGIDELARHLTPQDLRDVPAQIVRQERILKLADNRSAKHYLQ